MSTTTHRTLFAVLMLGVAAGSAAADEPALRFGRWQVHHMHSQDRMPQDASRASLLTEAGFISVECARQGEATLLAAWVPDARLGSPDDYTPREITLSWDGGEAVTESWEAFVGAAWKRDDAYARAFADRLERSRTVTLSALDEKGRRQERTYDLGPDEDTRAAMARVREDCRHGWH